MSESPLVIVNAVGMTRRWLGYAATMQRLAERGWVRTFREVVPAVTCSAQATLLTGELPRRHGIVANGWFYRDTGEVRFWQQSNRLIQAEPFYVAARRQAAESNRSFRTAKLFWWFNQGADVDFSVTPKPYYGADGDKRFGITGRPEGLTERLEQELGAFPFPTFWGPMAGEACTRWIAQCAASVLDWHRPDLALVYLPHLDYDPQRFGPDGADMARLVGELDQAVALVAEAAARIGARIWIVSEYGHVNVNRPVYLNRVLRQQGLLKVRFGPFGETLETFESDAFAVCDHQIAHVYVRRPDLVAKVAEVVRGVPGVAQVSVGAERKPLGLDHPRSGEVVALSARDAWFAYPYWLDDRRAPDFARTVDIHRKPGFDPCELFFDPRLWWPRGRAIWRLVQKKLGFRTLFDVIPLDARLVRGSHGLAAEDPLDRPIWIGDGPQPEEEDPVPMTAFRRYVLNTSRSG